MVYEGRRNVGRGNVGRRSAGRGNAGRGRRNGGNGGAGWLSRACVWLLLLVVAAWVVFPGTMRELRDRALEAVGIDIQGAVRVFREERDGGAGFFGAAKSSVKYAFGAQDGDQVPVGGTEPGEARPAVNETGSDEFADLPLPKYVSAETPELTVELLRPVEGEVTSPFGYRRGENGADVSFHYGVDLSAPSGAQVLAMAQGEVMAVGESTTYGRYVIISHRDGVETICAHLGEAKVAGGETVEAGQVIGVMGDGAQGAYLHLELIVDGMYVDPAGYLR